MDKAAYYALPVLSYNQIRSLGHLQQMGIYKPAGSDYATSIITNVGEERANYEDNLSEELVLSYHGQGRGRDQTLDDYVNLALAKNFEDQVPVRVFAGTDNRYRDWGMWQVIDLRTITGVDGFLKLVYYMVPIHNGSSTSNTTTQSGIANQNTRYASRTMRQVKQQVRYAPELTKLKKAYNYTCQVDAEHVLPGRNGLKAVVHHLEPVGLEGALVTPGHGNEIVLCPNCHALFDDGSIYIDPSDGVTLHHWEGNLAYEGKQLRFIEGHQLDKDLLLRVKNLHWGAR